MWVHGGPATRLTTDSRKLKQACTGFSFARLLRENPGLQAVAYTFMNVRGNGKKPPRPKRQRRRLHQRRRLAHVQSSPEKQAVVAARSV